MAINTSGLSTYVDEQRLPLIRKAVLGAPTINYFTLQTEVKGKTALNLLDTTVAFGDGSTCGWNEEGETTFSQRFIDPAIIKVNMSFCEKKLLKHWMNYMVRVAAGQKTLPFEQEFIDSVIEKINEKLDKFIWQGETINSVKYKGILDLLTDASVTDLGKGATLYESAVKLYKAMPAAGIEDSAIYVGIDTYRDLSLELTAKNLYHYDPTIDSAYEMLLPGTTMKVRGVPGLNGTNKMVGLNNAHTFYGTDMSGDEERFDFWYSKDNQEFRLAVEFVAGQQFAYADECKIIDLGA